MSRLGGLLNRMPATGLFALIGSMAISALPPLNGFVSEWLILQAVLLGSQFPQWTLKLLAPTVGASIALTAALAAACFVRMFGISFLGRPRSPAATAAKEVDRYSLAAMAGLALLCVLPGLLPGLLIDALKPAVQLAVGATMPLQIEDRLALDRADRGEPKLLQRAAGLHLHHHLGQPRGVRDPPFGFQRAAPRAGLGLRISRAEPGDAIYGREFRPADTARVRQLRLRRARKVDMPPPGDLRPPIAKHSA